MRKINLTVFTEYSIAGMFTVIFLIPTVAFGTSVSFDEWLESFRQEARAEKISNATIESAFKNLKQNKRVLELDQKQPEFGLTSLQYLKRLVSVKKVLNGAKRLKQNQSLLLEVEKKYNVQPRFVVALWGIETDYGRLTGGFSVIEALVTLAYDGRRSAFFRTELMNALHILDQGHIVVDNMSGSWAGAMGQCQFMPSSFRKFAQDFNNDGKQDIWTTLSDVFASAANYLAMSGWNHDQTWGREVIVPKSIDKKLLKLDIQKSLQQWQDLGVRRLNRSALPKTNLQASIIQPDGPSGKSYLVYENFRVLLKWNRSFSFAIAVGRLSDKIAAN